LELLSSRLPKAAHIYAAGGAPRNVIIAELHGSAPPTRDIDIFIGGLPRGFRLTDVLGDQPTRPTDLKGIRWQPPESDMAYDLSLLTDFLVIAVYGLEPTLDNLLTGIDFTMNAIIYDFRRRTLVEKGCTAAIQSRRLDFNSRLIPDKSLMAYRILLMAYKTGFCLGEPVFNFLRHRLDLDTVRELKGLLRAKVGKTTAAAIMARFDDLCRYHAYDAYRAAEDLNSDGS
jgi:hypothetical protein